MTKKVQRRQVTKQKEMAKKLGISKSYLSMILSGKSKANPEIRERISSLEFVNFKAGISLRGRYPKPLNECATQKNMAGEEGFEPSLTDSESAVLPLDDSPSDLKL